MRTDCARLPVTSSQEAAIYPATRYPIYEGWLGHVGILAPRTVRVFMIHQKGFISLGLSGYLAIGAGVVILALGLAVKVQTARLDASQQKALALEQQVAQWTAAAKECSDATKKADEEAKKRARNAAIALEAARKGQASSKAEAERLRGLIGSKPATDCPARDGVAEVRKGLK